MKIHFFIEFQDVSLAKVVERGSSLS
jgi:hypothetical protein